MASRTPLVALLLVVAALAGIAPAERRVIRLVDVVVTAAETAPRRCEAGADSRESLVLAAGEEIVTAVTVPPSATLRYALASDEPALPVPPWHLSVEDSSGGAALAVDEAAPSHAWTERALDLARLAGRRVLVRARAATVEGDRAAHLCWAAPRIVPRARTAPLVIVVLLDTVRADHLSLLGYERRTSPALEALARDGVTFTDAASDAAWTRPSVATLLTGVPALAHGVLARDAHLGTEWPTLAERLRAAGMDTVALSTNPNVLPFWGFARGFNRFVDVGAEAWTENSDAADVLALARDAVDAAGHEPLFLYVHINDAHSPYDPPPAAAAALLGSYDPASPGRVLGPDASPAEVRAAVDRYDAEISHLDAELGRFLDELRARGRYGASSIVVVGDHGEEFMDHGGVYHGHTLFREQLHVPLVLKLPALAGAGTRSAAPAATVDVLPTLLATLGLPRDGLVGRVLAHRDGRVAPGTSMPRFAVTDVDDATAYAVEDAELTLIVQTRPRLARWLFDRSRDPAQRDNLVFEKPQDLARLQRVLDERLLARRAGWHLRLCGGHTPATVTVTVSPAPPPERLERLDLEDDDAVTVDTQAGRLTLVSHLAPRPVTEEQFGKLVTRERPDRDELVFGVAGPLTVAVTPASVRLRLGAWGTLASPEGGAVTVEQAAAPPAFTPACGDEETVLLWHAGPAEAEQPADPELARRLRALGYLQ